MSIPQTLEHFEVPEAVARLLDQPALWWQAVAMFVKHFADWENSWQASVGDDTNERRQVHALRSAAANVGATRLAVSAATLEKVLAAGVAGEEIERAGELRRQLQQDFRQTWRTAAEATRFERKESAD